MTFTTLADLLISDRIAAIDFQMAESILDRLGYNIYDLSFEFDGVAIENGEISHQLWYDSIDNACTVMGYVRQENGIYYVSGKFNYSSYQQACLELLDTVVVEDCRYAIELERAVAIDYF